MIFSLKFCKYKIKKNILLYFNYILKDYFDEYIFANLKITIMNMYNKQTRKQEFTIEKGVPITRSNSGRPCKYPWAEMSIGDSIFVKTTKVSPLVCAIAYGRSHNKAFVSKLEHNGRRIWRTK